MHGVCFGHKRPTLRHLTKMPGGLVLCLQVGSPAFHESRMPLGTVPHYIFLLCQLYRLHREVRVPREILGTLGKQQKRVGHRRRTPLREVTPQVTPRVVEVEVGVAARSEHPTHRPLLKDSIPL